VPCTKTRRVCHYPCPPTSQPSFTEKTLHLSRSVPPEPVTIAFYRVLFKIVDGTPSVTRSAVTRYREQWILAVTINSHVKFGVLQVQLSCFGVAGFKSRVFPRISTLIHTENTYQCYIDLNCEERQIKHPDHQARDRFLLHAFACPRPVQDSDPM